MALLRPCLGCGRLTANSRCGGCARVRDRARGSTTERFGPGWASISKAIIERDGGICHICGQPGADTTDHLHPRAYGGDSTDLEMLAAAHRVCNSRRGARFA
jgi:5-methylcytosine-specific restriction endonuclease McrA